ncbi:histidine kinase [Kribbella flavida DSM 17836]|uniref:Signal transduction histidine-protein kinase/phosphatase MprB n=1 Tax=Kribbella flavida (strain DSM 17836 / JCM 10339 / NBRC 14399) TaxID=479435 RepID=D2PQ28_KRIFD|nr:HAMP domain-containing sensor histidine kinase [Kribbella flavida]ADB32952.1 histidine kinase [Kribbella flavida DSM 17836]
MTKPRGPLASAGLRHRLVLAFGAVTLLVSTIFAASTYLLARNYMLAQRERAVKHQALADAAFVQRRLESAGADISAVFTAAGPPAENMIVLRWGDQWYASALDSGHEDVPSALRTAVEAGQVGTQRFRTEDGPALALGVPLASVDAEFYEVAPLGELDENLRLLSIILASGALVAAAAGAALGGWAGRSAVTPLNRVAAAAARIAGGHLETRLPVTRDPELTTIVGSFNSMVDTLQQRIERDARLAADVSHELRSPLTTLVGSVDLLNARRDELSPRSQQALDLVTADLDRFRRLLDDLLELARSDAGLDQLPQEPVNVWVLLRHVISEVSADSAVLRGPEDVEVTGDKSRLSRLFRNLLENAERHGGGLASVEISRLGAEVVVTVDDSGTGVPAADRERIFERFATGPSRRGSSSGTGLGLALVAETAAAHGGAVWCTDAPGGGARFVVRLPAARS